MADRRVEPADPFLVKYQPSELKIASEFLTTWLPFLSRDLCSSCTDVLSDRIRSLELEVGGDSELLQSDNLKLMEKTSDNQTENFDGNSIGSGKDKEDTNSLGSWKDGENGLSREGTSEPSSSRETHSPRMSWADMAQEDELEEDGGEDDDCDVEGEDDQESSSKRVVNVNSSTGNLRISKVIEKPKLSREQREYIRFTSVQRKKDFICLERIKGKLVNIVDGLELHSGIFSAAEQKRIVNYVYMLEEKGRRGELRERTFTAPQKWMRGKGRVTIQFGCCYNYATDRKGNPPGILSNENVDPLPDLFKVIIRRLVKWHVLPPTCVPDSCIVNIYDEGDCIPPHIDNHDFVRPFCTVSFLSEWKMIFGSNLKIAGPGEFDGPYSIPLPMGSVLVLNGNGADVAKHCVPAVPAKRISITFRRMDESKRPNDYAPEPDLEGIVPLPYDVAAEKTNGPKVVDHPRKRYSDRRGNHNNMAARGSAGRGDVSQHSEYHNPIWGQRGPANWRRSG
ncbi:RNA demethylase ALKBH9B [Cannabis sativa]|uniref:RNA demethylase ALKBH9B n=1 Tax=Cannabis sativa TaxID=3483 RepID=UPI0029CA04D2|nr:RNA demethylase ALKBH9B [Cannabis sativa]